MALLVATGLLAPALEAPAHDLGVGRVELAEIAPGRYRLEAKLARVADAPRPVVPAPCRHAREERRFPRATTQLVIWHFECERPLGPNESVMLPWDQQALLVSVPSQNRLELLQDPAPDGFAVTTGPGVHPGGVGSMLLLGIEHILLGFDHLAFVTLLTLLSSGWRRVAVVTGFTVGHSATLVLAAIDVVRLPGAPVEATIALSIVFAARESLRGGPGTSLGPTLAAGFGLIHGLGFASVLAESGAALEQRWLGLLAFNAGVEIGQLLFVGVVASLLLCTTRLGVATARSRAVVGFVLGCAGSFWAIERFAALGT